MKKDALEAEKLERQPKEYRTKIEEMKCRSCGGTLSAKDITLVNGAPVVNCPFCGTTYQLTEEPKW